MKKYVVIGLTALLAACSSPSQTPPPAGGTAPSVDTSGVLTTLAVTPIGLTVGQTRQITINVNGQPAQPGQLAWKSSNAAVVTVTQTGLLTAVGAGSASVRVSLIASPATYLDIPVNVSAPVPVPTPTPAPAPSPTPAPTPTPTPSPAPAPSPTPAPAPTPTPTPTPAPAPAPTPTPAPTPPPPPSSFAQQVLTLTNQARTQARSCGGQSFAATSPLSWNDQLAQAAQGHAADMAAKNYFDHNSQDGRTPWQRIAATGYQGRMLAENIAAGQRTPEAVVQGWLNSPGHCANIMNPGLKELGVGYATGGSYGSYWVQDFGTR